MLGKMLGRVRRINLEKLANRAGAFLSARRVLGQRVLMAAGFAFVVLLVHREVYTFISHRKQFSIPSVSAVVVPRWTDSRGEEIVRVDTDVKSIFDPGLVERTGRAFEACPWVKKVTAVERVFPDKLRVRFEYRQPHVAVRRANGYVVVDETGVRLPGVYVDAPRCARSVEITGVVSLPPEPGRAWDDPALRAALSLADFVQENGVMKRIGIREVDVSNVGGRVDPRRSEVVLVASNGCSLYWGRMPSAARFGDTSVDEKLESLREVMAVYPDLDGLRCVKLYFKGSRAVERADAHAQRPR